MRRIMAVVLFLSIALLPSVAFAAPRPQGIGRCQYISGHFVGAADPQPYGFNSIVVSLTGQLSGPAVGSTLTQVTVRRQTSDGTIYFSETGDFHTTELGELTTSGGGRIDGPTGHVDDYLLVVGGGSGFIYATGTANFAIGQISVDYYGFVCTDPFAPGD